MVDGSASCAAALAAFKALGQKKEDDISRYNKIPTNHNNNSHYSEGVKTSQTPQNNRSLPKIQTRNIAHSNISPLTTPKTSKPKSNKSTPTKSVLEGLSPKLLTPPTKTPEIADMISNVEVSQDHGHSNFNKSTSFPIDYLKSPYTPLPTITKSPTSFSGSSLPQDMIKNIKQSIESKSIPKSAARLSSSYEPQEMIKSIKTSINNRNRSSSSQPFNEPSERNKLMLSQIRQSIDLKRIFTLPMRSDDEIDSLHVPITSGSDSNGLLKSPISYGDTSSSEDLRQANDNLGNPQNIFTFNKSMSSFGSNYLDFDYVESTINNPDITLNNETALVDEVKMNRETIPIPIPSPRSSHSRLRLGSSVDSLPSAIGRISLDHKFIDNNNGEERNKPRRKPPPPDDVSLSDSLTRKTNDRNQNLAVANDEYDTEMENLKSLNSSHINSEMEQFKKFPDIKVRHHHRPERIGSSIFNLGKSKKLKELYNAIDSLELEEDSDSEVQSDQAMSNEYTAANALITHQNQPVKLKKTMRKVTRKTKKKLFNENKPWKNHSDLNYLTDQEKKRYEGLFVSNKGNYFDRVVRKLVGVDYNKLDNYDSNGDEDDSTKAAKLSAKTLEAGRNLHNLKSAQVDQLIHGSVVKRIWIRSRLPKETLQAIWNLVDFRKDGTLNKPEFLVGMWLIDQCLYGRKLPKKIDPIVWENLGNIGINVVIKKKGRR